MADDIRMWSRVVRAIWNPEWIQRKETSHPWSQKTSKVNVETYVFCSPCISMLFCFILKGPNTAPVKIEGLLRSSIQAWDLEAKKARQGRLWLYQTISGQIETMKPHRKTHQEASHAAMGTNDTQVVTRVCYRVYSQDLTESTDSATFCDPDAMLGAVACSSVVGWGFQGGLMKTWQILKGFWHIRPGWAC